MKASRKFSFTLTKKMQKKRVVSSSLAGPCVCPESVHGRYPESEGREPTQSSAE